MSYLELTHTQAQACISQVDDVCSSLVESTEWNVAADVNIESTMSESAFAVLHNDFFLYLGRSGCEQDSLSVPVMRNLMFIEDELASPNLFSTLDKADGRENVSTQSFGLELYCLENLRKWCQAVLNKCLRVSGSVQCDIQTIDSIVARQK